MTHENIPSSPAGSDLPSKSNSKPKQNYLRLLVFCHGEISYHIYEYIKLHTPVDYHNPKPNVGSSSAALNLNSELNWYPPGSCFLFLSLPGEIRNRVYDFALYQPEGLRFSLNKYLKPVALRHTDSLCRTLEFADNSIDETDEFNQLKFVCRQLYKETAGLELKFNSVILEGNGNDLPGLLPSSTAHFSGKLKWLTSFTVARPIYMATVDRFGCFSLEINRFEYLPLRHAQLRNLVQLCKDVIPHVKVRFMIPGINLNYDHCDDFVAVFEGLTMMVRGIDIGLLADRASIAFCKAHYDAHFKSFDDVPNLQFFSEVYEFDEDAFRAFYSERLTRPFYEPHLTPYEVDEIMRYTLQFIENGI